MKRIIFFLLILAGLNATAQQTYNPVNGTLSNKSYAPAQAVPTDFRQYYYDSANFIMRLYQDTVEVLQYLNLPKFRAGNFLIFVNDGGFLNPNGTFTGGVTSTWWFKDGTDDVDLVPFGTDQGEPGWRIEGNSNIVDGTHFLGTISAVALDFRVNSQRAGRINFQTDFLTAYGYQAFNPASTAAYNTAIGFQSMRNNTIGISNTATGYQTLYNNTSGFNNSVYGINSMFNNIDGVRNTAYGVNTLYSNTSGSFNIAMGEQAMFNNLTGINNVGIAVNALYFNTSGNGNTAVGGNTLFNNTTGDGNVGYGDSVLLENISGSYNTGFGYGALYGNTTGFYNVGVGYHARTAAVDTRNGVALGTNSLASSDQMDWSDSLKYWSFKGHANLILPINQTDGYLRLQGDSLAWVPITVIIDSGACRTYQVTATTDETDVVNGPTSGSANWTPVAGSNTVLQNNTLIHLTRDNVPLYQPGDFTLNSSTGTITFATPALTDEIFDFAYTDCDGVIDTSGNINATLPSGQIFVGNSIDMAQARPMTGDVAIDNVGNTTVQPDVITFSKIQNVPGETLEGKSTAGPGDMHPIYLGNGLSFRADTIDVDALPIKTVITLTDGSFINWNTDLSINAQVTLTGNNHTLAITNDVDGDIIALLVTQNGTGGWDIQIPAGDKMITGIGSGSIINLPHAPGAQSIISGKKWGSIRIWTRGDVQ